MVSNNSGNAIVLLLLAIGVSVFSYSKIKSMINSPSKNIDKEISLNNINPSEIGAENFYLVDFYYKTSDFNKLDNQNYLLLLYQNNTDTIARLGIEVKDKLAFKTNFIEQKRVLVDAKGSMYCIVIDGDSTLFGYGDFISTHYTIDKNIKSRSITLRFIPEKSLSKDWLNVLILLLLPISLFSLSLLILKKSIQEGEF